MVKGRKHNTKKKRNGKGFTETGAKAKKINASTEFETCTEQLWPEARNLDNQKILTPERRLKV